MKKIKLLITFLLCACISSAAFAAESITVATNPNWPPFESVDLNKQIIGYDIDILNAIGEELGLEVKILSTAWDGIFATLDSKQSDIIASTVTITDVRKRRYLFSEPYAEIKQSVIVPNNSTIAKPEDIKGKTVGIQIGTSAEIALKKLNININLKTYDDVGLAFEDLKNGNLDAVACDDPVGRYYANRKEGFSDIMKLAFITGDVEELGFVFRKSDTKLANDVNKALNTLRANGEEAEIRRKWFGDE